jgi:hypothetical protein
VARQRIMPGQEIDVVTPEELAEYATSRDPNIVLGLGGNQMEEEILDSPMRGTIRQLTSWRRGTGADNLIIPAAQFVTLCGHNPHRVAGSLINALANPVYVYLAALQDVQAMGFGAVSGVFTGVLATQWSNFDFKLTNDVWCGPVQLYSPLGTTVVWGEH